MGNTEKKLLGGLGILALLATGAGAAGVGPLAAMMGSGGTVTGGVGAGVTAGAEGMAGLGTAADATLAATSSGVGAEAAGAGAGSAAASGGLGAGAKAFGGKVAEGALTSAATQGMLAAAQPEVSQETPLASALPALQPLDLEAMMKNPSRLATLKQLGYI